MSFIISWFKKHKEFILDGLIAVGIAVLVMTFIKPVMVSGDSMLPNLQDNNYLLLSRQAYTFGEPKHGQIVVFPVKKDGDKLYIKRVIGIPGDTVKITGGKVYINGTPQDQSYTNEGYTPGDIKKLKIPKGKLFVMGDNRAHSQDSRSDIVGLLNIKDVSGVVFFRLWPFSEFGTLDKYE